MSEINENQIRERLERLSKIEPTQEATERALQRVRDTVGRGRSMCLPRATTRGRPYGLPPILRFLKLAAAAVVLIAAGVVAGRFSAPPPINVEALRAELEVSLKTSLQQSLVREMDNRWQSTFDAGCAQLKDELQQQVRRDLMQFAAQTLTASGTQMERQLRELIQLIEAARIRDRRNIEAALDHIESQFGSGLAALASHTNELQRLEQN
jgi:hypothetical protein